MLRVINEVLLGFFELTPYIIWQLKDGSLESLRQSADEANPAFGETCQYSDPKFKLFAD